MGEVTDDELLTILDFCTGSYGLAKYETPTDRLRRIREFVETIRSRPQLRNREDQLFIAAEAMYETFKTKICPQDRECPTCEPYREAIAKWEAANE